MHIGLDPEIAQIGSFSVGWHGVLMFIGIAVGLALTAFFLEESAWSSR